MLDRNLSEELRMMRQSCRDFVDGVVLPFIRENWQREWSMTPEDRLPPFMLEEAEKIGIRTLGVPEEFGGIELDKAKRRYRWDLEATFDDPDALAGGDPERHAGQHAPRAVALLDRVQVDEIARRRGHRPRRYEIVRAPSARRGRRRSVGNLGP